MIRLLIATIVIAFAASIAILSADAAPKSCRGNGKFACPETPTASATITTVPLDTATPVPATATRTVPPTQTSVPTSNVSVAGTTWSIQHLPERNGLSAFFYGHDTFAVLFTDGTRTSSVPIPVRSSPQQYWDATLAWTADDELWFWGGVNPVVAKQFRLAYGSDGLPISAMLLQEKFFGETTFAAGVPVSKAIASQGLESGGFAGFWADHVYNTAIVTYHSAYFKDGTWQTTSTTLENPREGSGTPGLRATAAQHPVDDNVWLFAHRDATNSVPALRYAEAPWRVVAADVNWLADSDGDPTADADVAGEFPKIAAVPWGTAIALVYNNDHFVIYDAAMGTFTKGTNQSIALVDADGGRTYLPEYTGLDIERDSPLGLTARGDRLLVSHWAIDLDDLSRDNIRTIAYGLDGSQSLHQHGKGDLTTWWMAGASWGFITGTPGHLLTLFRR